MPNLHKREPEDEVMTEDQMSDSDSNTKVSSSDEVPQTVDSKVTFTSTFTEFIDTRLPYRHGWPLLPAIPVLTSRKDIKKSLSQDSAHLTALRAILDKQALKYENVQVCHRYHEGCALSKSTMTLCVQAPTPFSHSDEKKDSSDKKPNDSWIKTIHALKSYIQTHTLTLSVEIIDPRAFNHGIYTHALLPTDFARVLALIKKKTHAIKTLLDEHGAEWSSLGFYRRGLGRKRSECEIMVVIGSPQPEASGLRDVVVPEVRELVKGRLGVEVIFEVVRKC